MLSLVIPVYTPTPALDQVARECLSRVAQLDCQLVVVANGTPVDVSADVLVELPTNRGYAGGVNAGLARAEGDWIAVGSADVVPPPEWVEASCVETVVSPMERPDTPHLFWGGLWTMPGACFEKVGLLDESIDRISDQDYAIRAHQAGYPARRIPIAVEHHKTVENRQVWNRRREQADNARFKKRYGVLSYTAWVG